MKRTNMKQNLLNPLNPLTILGFFRGVTNAFYKPRRNLWNLFIRGIRVQKLSGSETIPSTPEG
jgi:hypothetical protein